MKWFWQNSESESDQDYRYNDQFHERQRVMYKQKYSFLCMQNVYLVWLCFLEKYNFFAHSKSEKPDVELTRPWKDQINQSFGFQNISFLPG